MQSRVEEDIQNLIGSDEILQPPQSRIEKLLHNLLDGITPTEPPQSRIEELILQLGIGGTSGKDDASNQLNLNDINFIDYDGSLIESWTLEELTTKTSLPENPSHDGLIAQGWNCSLEDLKAENKPLIVGQIYTTSDGKTRLYINIVEECYEQVSIHISQTVANGVTIDWGDGSTTETVDGIGNVSATHTYESVGDYVIALSPIGDCVLGFDTTGGVDKNASLKLTKVELGVNVTTIGDYAFRYCYDLETITIPNSVSSMGKNVFEYCINLQFVIIPQDVVTIGDKAFLDCHDLKSISLPYGVASLSKYEFENCNNLQFITIPNSVKTIGVSAFDNCYNLREITIPDDVITIGNNAFEFCHNLQTINLPADLKILGANTFGYCYNLQSFTIPNVVTVLASGVFSNCSSLRSIVIPSSVTSIKDLVFNNCKKIREYHLLSTTPPALSNVSAFTGIRADCVIYVPQASLETYKAAANWSTYASQMVGE